ncbi:DNA topoisomerase, partial [Escherichia coli]|uniref:DNA topoisomerase n=1 Tax=Escherichia coli TaxID=562 RepID=UPI00110202D3
KVTHLNGEKLEQFTINNEKDATKAVENLKNLSYSVTDIEKKQSKRSPQPPFTTSSLQQDAARKLRFTTKKTMMLAQRLYEGVEIDGEAVGLITYMRTDSVNISADALAQTRKIITKIFGEKYLHPVARVYQSKAKNAQEA